MLEWNYKSEVEKSSGYEHRAYDDRDGVEVQSYRRNDDCAGKNENIWSAERNAAAYGGAGCASVDVVGHIDQPLELFNQFD